MSSKIYFADCLPGYGKTYWAIKSMALYHKKKDSVCIYSAPTHKLLGEVFKRLVKAGVSPKHIHYIKEEEIFRVSAKQNLYCTVAGNRSGSDSPFDDGFVAEGDIILITHSNLWNNQNHPIFNRDFFPRREDMRLFIDEARDCQMNKLSIPINGELTLKNILAIFGLGEKTINTGKYYPVVITPEILKKCRGYLGKKITRKLVRVSGMSNIKLRNIGNRKTYAYITMNGDVEEGEFTIQSIMTPFSFLSGWKSFVLLSAMFKSSQFYHLLKLCSHINSLTQEQQDLLGEIPSIYLIDITNKIISPKRKEQMKKRFDQTYFTYLLTNNISKEKIDGVIVPQKNLDTVRRYSNLMYDMLGEKFAPASEHPIYSQISTLIKSNFFLYGKYFSEQEIERLKNYQQKVISNCLCKTKDNEKIPYSPLDYLTRKSCAIAHKWINDPKNNCLKNSKFILININKHRILNWCFSDEDKGILYDSLVSDKVKKYAVNISGDIRGLDCYKSTDVACFLSSNRLHPLLRRWFIQFCPSYDAELDTLVGTAIQTLLRCSVRDSSSNSKPLLIVATKEMAERIVETIGLYLNISKENILDPEYFGCTVSTLIARCSSKKYIEKLKAYDREYHQRDYVKARAKLRRETLDFKVKNYFLKSFVRELNSRYCSIFGIIKRSSNEAKILALKREREEISKKITLEKQKHIKEFSAKWKIDKEFTEEWTVKYEAYQNVNKDKQTRG